MILKIERRREHDLIPSALSFLIAAESVDTVTIDESASFRGLLDHGGLRIPALGGQLCEQELHTETAPPSPFGFGQGVVGTFHVFDRLLADGDRQRSASRRGALDAYPI